MSDFKISLLALILIAVLALGGVHPIHGGFWCKDPDIGFKFQGDTCSTAFLLSFAIIPVLPLVIITELSNLHQSISFRPKLDQAWKRALQVYGNYWVGGSVSLVLNEILKTIVSEARPHFEYSCDPDYEAIGCKHGEWVPYNLSQCLNVNLTEGVSRQMFEAMKSFPSGHAQLSWFAAVFVFMYVQERMGTSLSVLFKHLVQFVWIIFAFWASLTRISDRRHHWWDVLFGAVFGIIAGYITVVHRCGSFVGMSSISPRPRCGTTMSQDTATSVLSMQHEVARQRKPKSDGME